MRTDRTEGARSRRCSLRVDVFCLHVSAPARRGRDFQTVSPTGLFRRGPHSVVKVAPVYPSQAKRRGIEGYVLLEFVVAKSGAVRYPQIIEPNPPGVFDRASIAAALKSRPKVINGQPIALSGVRNLFTFELSDG